MAVIKDPFTVAVIKHPFAVAVINYSWVVAHILRTLSQTVANFLGKYTTVCFCKVTGVILNHATGFGLKTFGCLPVLWPPGLHRKAEKHFVVAKNCTA